MNIDKIHIINYTDLLLKHEIMRSSIAKLYCITNPSFALHIRRTNYSNYDKETFLPIATHV